MSAESPQQNPYAAVLADLRAKRAEIDKTIKFLEGMSEVRLPADIAASEPVVKTTTDQNSVDSRLDEGAFHGMSIVDATKKLLALRKRKMGNPEIARELASGGLVMNSVDPVNTVGSVLTRRFNQVGDIVKVARGTWGLKEWYPNRTFKNATKQTGEDIDQSHAVEIDPTAQASNASQTATTANDGSAATGAPNAALAATDATTASSASIVQAPWLSSASAARQGSIVR